MNLIKRRIKPDTSNILKFRRSQYDMIAEFFEISFEYLNKFGLDTSKLKFSVEPIKSYRSKFHYRAMKIIVDLDGINFISLDIPELLDHFFVLNGAKYIPSLYIVDLPISIKKNSISIYSLFNPVSFFISKNYIIVSGRNIPMSRFFSFFYSEDETKEILDTFECEYRSESEEVMLLAFSKVLNVAPNRKEIEERFNDLFLDRWTKELYESVYDKRINTFKDIIDIVVYKYTNEEKPSFIDLNHKRLMFIELILGPLFKAVSDAVRDMVVYNKDIYKLPLDANAVIKNFSSKLNGNFLISDANGFSGLTSLKASFKSPGSSVNLPQCVSDIHPSFKGKICTITISNKNPGMISSLVPNQNVELRTGQFIFNDES